METNNPNWVQVVSMILSAILIVGAIFVLPGAIGNAVTVAIAGISIPTAAEIVAEADIPTAEDIADLIDIPEAKDTAISVRDEKEALAEELATEELNDDDFLEWLAEEIYSWKSYKLKLDDDFDENDIEDIQIKDVEVKGIYTSYSEYANVEFVAKVTIDDEGDEEAVRVEFTIDVENLDRSEDYEDAEVVDGNPDGFEITKCYDNFCELD